MEGLVQDILPILNIVLPHSPHLPLVAGRPFFIVTCSASWISLLSRHFIQYPVIEKPLGLYSLIGMEGAR